MSELIPSDVCDLHSTPTIGEKKYFLTFTYDYSRYCYVYLLHSKDEDMKYFQVDRLKLNCIMSRVAIKVNWP